MTIDDPASDPLVVRSLREIMLLELQRQVPAPDEGVVMQMELVERRLVQMAIAGDLAAIKEIHDRSDGKVPSAPRPEQQRQHVTVEWMDHSEDSHAPNA
jgi:hypothetical protein